MCSKLSYEKLFDSLLEAQEVIITWWQNKFLRRNPSNSRYKYYIHRYTISRRRLKRLIVNTVDLANSSRMNEQLVPILVSSHQMWLTSEVNSSIGGAFAQHCTWQYIWVPFADLWVLSKYKSMVKATKFVPSQWLRVKIANPQMKSTDLKINGLKSSLSQVKSSMPIH